jgi:hypothetical protein
VADRRRKRDAWQQFRARAEAQAGAARRRPEVKYTTLVEVTEEVLDEKKEIIKPADDDIAYDD